MGNESFDFRIIFDSSLLPCLLLESGPEYKIIAANDRYLSLTGLKRERIVGRRIIDVVAPKPYLQNPEDFIASLGRIHQGHNVDFMDVVNVVDANGSRVGDIAIRYFRPINSKIVDNLGNMICIAHNVEDITEFVLARERDAKAALRRIEETKEHLYRMEKEVQLRVADLQCANTQLKLAEESFRSSFENAAIGMAIVALDGRWMRVNKSLCSLLGYSEGELLKLTFQDITHPDDLDADLENVRQLVTGEILTYQMEKRYFVKGGDTIWILLNVSLLRDEAGCPIHFISQIQDITDRKEAEADLVQRAYYDTLTGLPNRTLFNDRFSHAIAQAKRDSHRLAVLFLDLDLFKSVNDRLGHHIGDILLKNVSERLLDCVREVDTVGRYSGDEFVILLPSIANHDDAYLVAYKIIEAFSHPFDIQGHILKVTSSIGVAIYPDHGTDVRSLLRAADMAMYSSKRDGRNNVCVYGV